MLAGKENIGALDFIMTGPDKVMTGHVEMSRMRGEMYATAVYHSINASAQSFAILGNTVTVDKEIDAVYAIVEAAPLKLVCYYSLPDNESMTDQLWPELVDPLLCTHILIAFANADNRTIQPTHTSDVEIYHQIVDMKKQNPTLKVMISIQCFSNNGELAAVVDTKQSRQTFIASVVQFLVMHNFDGIDIDWEFPVWPGSDMKQLNDFTALLKELRTALASIQGDRKLISVAVAAPQTIVDAAYQVQKMAKYVDFVNLMAYDFHYFTSYLPITGPNAPLYQASFEQGIFTTLNTNWSAHYWLSKGMPLDKLVVGVPTYGHSFTLLNEENTGWDAPATGIGKEGLEGFVVYPDICRFLDRENTKYVFDSEFKVPYTYNGREWISYDNEQSLQYKADYIKSKGFGGVMIWSLNVDDFRASCGKNDFPLVRQVKNILEDDQL
uniref:Isolate 2 chitinase mRNA n=1 Tax=Nilaparvata lugens TaxID=108931 RepID=A0A0C5CUD5_NILLU|nr:chitinase [Nilaparvata lugens]